MDQIGASRLGRSADDPGMFGWLGRFIVYRVLGSRLLLVLTVLRFIQERLTRRSRPGAAYPPSQGASQTEQREPR